MWKEGGLLWIPVQDAGLTALAGALSGSAELGSALFFCLTGCRVCSQLTAGLRRTLRWSACKARVAAKGRSLRKRCNAADDRRRGNPKDKGLARRIALLAEACMDGHAAHPPPGATPRQTLAQL